MISLYEDDVEEVLNNATALDYFKQWIRLDPDRPEEAADLYFALRGFGNYLRSPDAAARAQIIHRRYISLRSGSCDFIPREIRQEMSSRIHGLKSSTPVPATLFEPIWQPLSELLKSWHSRFVCSEYFDQLKESESDESAEEYFPLGPSETMRRSRRPRYPCDPSTSKPERHEIPYRHEKEEDRSRFTLELTAKLQKIADELSRHGGHVYPRDLPKAFSEEENTHEKTMSDEEMEKYAEKLDRRRSDSDESPSADHFQPGPFVPPVRGYNFNIVIPERFTTNGRKARTSGFNDTSGFCSSESAYFSSERSYISNPFAENTFSQSSFSQTLQRKARPSQQNCFATLPRRPAQQTVQCRLSRDDEVAPYIADLRGPFVTLYQFRKTFAIRKDDNLRLLFKSPCDDGSAPFQWSLLTEDNAVLPLFEGRIVAEARRYVDSD